MAGRLAGWPADKIHEFLEFIIDEIIDLWLCLTNVQHYYSCTNAFKSVFRLKPIVRWVSRRVKIMHSLSIPTIKYYRT